MTIILLIILGYLPPLIVGLWWALSIEDVPNLKDTDGIILVPVMNWLLIFVEAPEILTYLKQHYTITWEDE